jgi:hypothetical protein
LQIHNGLKVLFNRLDDFFAAFSERLMANSPLRTLMRARSERPIDNVDDDDDDDDTSLQSTNT